MKYLLLIKETREVRDCTADVDNYLDAIYERTQLPAPRIASMLKSGRIKTADAEFWVEPDARKGGRPPMALGGGRFSPYRPASEETKQKQSESMKRVMAAKAIGKKRTWPPCAKCGELDGRATHPNVNSNPDRFKGERFGIDGKLCNACYQQEYRAAKGITSGLGVKKLTWEPCARCGDPDGRIHSARGATPSRYDGERFGFGVNSKLCRKCYEWGTRHRPAAPATASASAPVVTNPNMKPCVGCGDPSGRGKPGQARRIDGTRFGFKGDLCRKCWTRYYQREKAGRPLRKEAK